VLFFFQAEDGIRGRNVTGVQTCALPISVAGGLRGAVGRCSHPCRNAALACCSSSGSTVAHISRAECIDSSVMPTSIVVIPSRVAVIGPIVEPQGMALLDTKC